MGKIDDLLAQEASEAENYEMPEVVPAHVQTGRPNAGRGSVADRLERLEREVFRRPA